MSSWPLVKLGEVIEHRKEFIEIDDFAQYKRCRVQLHAQGIILRDIVSGLEIRTKKQQVCRSGELLVAEIDAKLGGYGIVPESLSGAIVSSHYFLFVIDESKLDRKFLGYFIRTHDFFNQISAQGSTNYAAIRPQQVLDYKIPLPPLDEQRRMVARIEALAAKVERAQSLRQKSATELDSFVTSLHIKLSGTKTSLLGEFLVLDEQREKVQIDHAYPQIGIKGFGQGLFAKQAVDGGQTTYQWFNQLYEGAIVLSQVKGWEGAIGVCPPSLVGYYASPEYRTFRCIEGKANPEYLAEILATPWFWKQLKNVERGLGGRRQRTRPEQFLRMKIPVPTVERQTEAIQILKKLKPIKRHQAATAARLAALLPSILDKAFRGEL